MLTDPIFYFVAVPAVLIAGISKGGFGSGASFVAAPLLAMVIDPAAALALLLPLLLLIDLAALPTYWRKWSARDTGRLILWSVPGVGLGALFLSAASPDLFRLMIAAICFAFVGYQLFVAKRVLAQPRAWPGWLGALTGAASAFTSTVSHAGGPLLAVYLLSRGIGKTTYQATTVAVFAAVNVLKAGAYAGLGLITADALLVGAVLVPVALLGTWLGVRAHRVVPERLFFQITYVLLIAAGVKLAYDALV